MRIASTSLLALFAAVLLGAAATGCCAIDGSCDVVADAGPPRNQDAGPGSPVATDGCDVADVKDQADGSVCASCDGTAICGAPTPARCESRENAAGVECAYCQTSDGAVLFDDCYASDPVPSSSCEAAPPTTGTDLSSGDVSCQSCTDANGVVVSTTCEPASDECHQTSAGCHECTKDGSVVVHVCPAPSITPRSCEQYQNDAGSCIDCFGDDDKIVLHDCTLSSQTNISCTQNTTLDGLVCLSCVDSNGGLVQQSCDGAVPELEQCTRLDYTDQTCIVCVDGDGNPAAWQCDSTTCADPTTGACAPPPDCAFEINAAGALCRTCPVGDSNGNNSGTEQRCVVDTNLLCGYSDSATDPNGNIGDTCLVCTDKSSGVEVYRRCDGQPVPPPACADQLNSDGVDCQVCSDQQSGQTVYATCGDQTCFATGSFQVTGADGQQLFLEDTPAVADCTECQGAAPDGSTVNTATANACSLRSDCGGVDLTDPTGSCSQAVVFTVSPLVCDNTWEVAGYAADANTDPGAADEITHVLAYALEQSQVGLIAIADVGAASPVACQNQCQCPRGDRFLISARPDDAVAVSQLFGAQLERCSSDADCETGGTCRTDGSCTAP